MATRVRELVHDAAEALARAAVDEPYLEASILLAHVLGKPRTWLFAYPEQEPDAETSRHFCALVNRRASGEPMAYLTGEREF